MCLTGGAARFTGVATCFTLDGAEWVAVLRAATTGAFLTGAAFVAVFLVAIFLHS